MRRYLHYGEGMKLSDYLKEEWVLTLGCTEPAAIALAAATAREGIGGEVRSINLTVDPKIYKNCYAVGIPGSGHRTGILWAVGLGSYITDPSLGLECFKAVTEEMIEGAGGLIDGKKINVEVDTDKRDLFIDCHIETTEGRGRAIIDGDHTNIVYVEKNGEAVLDRKSQAFGGKSAIRGAMAAMSIDEMIEFAGSATDADRDLLRKGIACNRKIAEHGLSLFPEQFVKMVSEESLTRMSSLVCAGVYARMWGEVLPVMSLAGAGNKGIVASVPLAIRGEELKKDIRLIDKALALACIITSATTHHLGTLSAVCGCSNAAGIGLSAGLILLEGGGAKEISLAMTNMVGNVTGMICDGAKIGCALKTMTAVDAAFRAASLAMSGVGIPPEDGIVGKTGPESLKNLGRIATSGMKSTDAEILKIMQDKLTGDR